jgi:hypothetical protein
VSLRPAGDYYTARLDGACLPALMRVQLVTCCSPSGATGDDALLLAAGLTRMLRSLLLLLLLLL